MTWQRCSTNGPSPPGWWPPGARLRAPTQPGGSIRRSDSGPTPPYVFNDAYTEERHYTDVRVKNGLSMIYHGIHHLGFDSMHEPEQSGGFSLTFAEH